MYETYNLQLDHYGGDDDRAMVVTENILSESVERCDSDDDQAGVKPLSVKTNDDIKKTMESFRENQSVSDVDDSIGDHLFNEFSDILSTERIGEVN